MLDPEKEESEAAAFEAFLAAHPTFAKQVARSHQAAEDRAADIVVTLTDGGEIDFLAH